MIPERAWVQFAEIKKIDHGESVGAYVTTVSLPPLYKKRLRDDETTVSDLPLRMTHRSMVEMLGNQELVSLTRLTPEDLCSVNLK